MKHQYFGDINDYRKYGLLRILSGEKLRIGICWMLTTDDGRTDGKFTNYLNSPDTWRSYDPILFDALYRTVKINGIRDVRQAEHLDIIPSATFYPTLLTDDKSHRQRYFTQMSQQFKDIDLIFFDPDNGLEVQSVLVGRKNSSKFLYWNELLDAFNQNYSILVYQHFQRKERDTFIREMMNTIYKKTGAAAIHSFHTANVVFFLAVQPRHVEHFNQQIQQIDQIWKGQIRVISHLPL